MDDGIIIAMEMTTIYCPICDGYSGDTHPDQRPAELIKRHVAWAPGPHQNLRAELNAWVMSGGLDEAHA